MDKNIVNTKGLGYRIKTLARIRKIPDEKLCSMLNINLTTLQCIYSGSNCPSLALLFSFSQVLDAPLDYLLVDSLNNKAAATDFMLNIYFNNKPDKQVMNFVKDFMNISNTFKSRPRDFLPDSKQKD